MRWSLECKLSMQDVDCSNRVNNSNEELPGNIELIVEMVNDLFILTQFCTHSRVKKNKFLDILQTV